GVQDDFASECSEDALPASSKKRDMAYTECTVVTDWLIDAGCGHDLISKQQVTNYKKFIHKAESPTVFHTANGKTTTNSVAWIHVMNWTRISLRT
ncbi:MAG: hypothetical protein ACKPKO_31100, partial [Candidatus Fonsibacter sp.]